jgi:Siphovirus Gp157
MASLLDLEKNRDALVEQIMASIEEGEAESTTCPADILAQFDLLETQIATKVDAIAAVVAAKEGEIAYLKSRRDRLDRQVEIGQNALDSFKTYLKNILERRDDPKIKGRESTIRLVKNGGKQTLWTNGHVLAQDFPPELVTVETSYRVCTETIRQQLAESGIEELVVGGKVLAKLQPRGTHIRID